MSEAEIPADEWVTLKEASGAAGVSVATLRKWYRAGSIPNRLEDGPYGPQQMVPLAAVLERASSAPAPSGGSQRPQTAPDQPVGVLIPMSDLAPLFQQLAEAQGQAAHYRAEAEFLRERLALLRVPDQEAAAPEAPRRRRWFGGR
jgi:hypothetical protein